MIGQSVAHYEITKKLGAGGMGEVYRATDTRLNRQVALKVLPQVFAQDEQRMGRFEREAQVLASLNHPNIASIYGLEEANGTKVLVMELVEGEDLSERIARGSIPLEEALLIALQIAEGLESAHEKGIIHRDLKPANIKLTADGKVKVLDFGLAKALEDPTANPQSEGLSRSPTLSIAATQAGVILGTAAYMSPEQARGQPVDKRADIWAFGCVLFEILTGQSTYSGETISDVLARVLERSPDWDKLPDNTPPEVRYLLSRCLEKKAQRRLRDIGEALILLETLGGENLAFAGPTTSELGQSSGQLGRGTVLLLLLAAVVTTTFLASMLTNRTNGGQLFKTDLAVTRLHSSQMIPPLISPDGLKVFYADEARLWVRDLTQGTTREVFLNTSGQQPNYPSWSPDSRSIAIASEGKFYRIDLETGRKFVVSPQPPDMLGHGGSAWLPGGRLLLVGGSDGVLEVSAQGGEPKALLELGEDETDFHEIGVLPEDRGFILSVHRAGKGADSLAVSDGLTRKWLLQDEGEVFASPAYSPSGHILYTRTTTNPGVWAIPFSLDTLEATGRPFLVYSGLAIPSVSESGTLLLAPSSESRCQLVWVNRRGEVLHSIGPERSSIPQFKLSPNGENLLVGTSSGGVADVWVENMVRGAETRVAFTAEAEVPGGWLSDEEPLIWVISQQQIKSHSLLDRTPTLPPISGEEPTVSANGRYAVFERFSDETLYDLWYIDFSAGIEPTLLRQTSASEFHPSLSPDGEFVAYLSDESGSPEVYIQELPDGEKRWKVSSGGGSNPRWNPAANELLFIEGAELVSVSVVSSPLLSLGEKQRLFDASANRLLTTYNYEVAPDGKRFLVPQLIDDGTQAPHLIIVQNWFEEFKGH